MLTVLENLKVRNVIIGKQFEDSENLQKFQKIVKNKKTNVIVVEQGDKINIEKDMYFYVLWPNSKNIVTKNSINNNALVCKFCYKSFSMLFTGDIEEEAENLILSENINIEANVLKVAHHRL